MAKTKYPWATWFRCKELCLVRGQDFNCQPYAMSIQFRRLAPTYRRKVSIEILGDALFITIGPIPRRRKK